MGIFKPPYGSRLNLGHPLARNIEFAVLVPGGINQFDRVRNQLSTISGDPAVGQAEVGLGLNVELEGTDSLFFSNRSTNSSRDITIFATFMRDSSDVGEHRPVFQTASSGDVGLLFLLKASGGFYFTKAGLVNISSGFTTTAGVPYLGILSYQHSSGDILFLLQNLLTGTIQTSSANNTATPLNGNGTWSIGGSVSYANFYGKIGSVLVWNQFFTTKQLLSLTINPYAMFEDPYPIELFASVAAEVGWTGIMDGITNPGKIDGISVANIKSINEIQ